MNKSTLKRNKNKNKKKKRFWIIDVQLQVWWAGLQIKSTYKFIGAVCLLLYPFTLGGREEKKKKKKQALNIFQ